MSATRWRKNGILAYRVALAALFMLLSLAGASAALAQGEPLYITEVRAIDTNDFGLLNPAGLAYSFAADIFFVLEADSTSQANIATMAPYEELLATNSVDVADIDPINMAFDNLAGRLVLFDGGAGELVTVGTGPDGFLDPSPAAITRYQVGPLGLQQPRGMAVDPVTGHLFILDSAALQIVRFEPGAGGDLDGAAALAEGRVSWLDLSPAGLANPRGLAFNPTNGHLYLLNPAVPEVYELDQAGRVAAILQLPPFEFVDPQGLVFALSGDATDDPAVIHLYIADTGRPEGQGTGQELGRILELSLHIVYVPGDASTIQAGIDLAAEGDLVLVAPGLYPENIQLAGKSITLASYFHTSRDSNFINETIIDGSGSTVITVAPSVGPDTGIIGFTIRNGNDGISASARLHILNNYFTGNKDAIDYETGGGICRYNVFENNRDDAIDLDGPVEVTIEDNIISATRDDGIEVRLHKYTGPALNIIIRRNIISDSQEDGIQLIASNGPSDRIFLIERNVIKGSAMAGLGLMDNRETREDFRGASIQDRINLFHNTFIDNDHGLTGGDNVIALNNIFVGSPGIALKNVDGNSVISHNLFWNNGIDYQNSNVDPTNTILADPELDESYRLLPGSPAIDAGTSSFTRNLELVPALQLNEYIGAAPDLGAYETQLELERLHLPVILKKP